MNNESSTLLAYINQFGMVGCNSCRYINSISDMGISLNAVMELIDRKEIFYSKVFMKRTVYMSRQLYFWLKSIRGKKAYNYYESHILQVMQALQPVNTKYLKAECRLNGQAYSKNFSRLLESMSITAYSTYEYMNPHWASMLYVTVTKWEESAQNESFVGSKADAEEAVKELLGRTIERKYIEKMIACVETE